MTVTAWQGELVERAYTFGRDLEATVPLPGISGVGPTVRPHDIARLDRGNAAGFDVAEANEIQIPLQLGGKEPVADLTAALTEMRAAWRNARTGEYRLDLHHPGIIDGVASFFGRPRGVTIDTSMVAVGYAKALAVFAATDPLAYSVEVDTGVETTTFEITSAGTEASDRATMTIVGDGSEPVITNLDHGGVIQLAGVLPIGDECVIDLHHRTVTTEGVAAPEDLDPISSWFQIHPGAQDIVVTGCASVQIVYRAAFA